MCEGVQAGPDQSANRFGTKHVDVACQFPKSRGPHIKPKIVGYGHRYGYYEGTHQKTTNLWKRPCSET